MTTPQLERLFEEKMKALTEAIQALGLEAAGLHIIIRNVGGVEAAKLLMQERSSTFLRLAAVRRLDLTVEALVVRPEFAPLFTEGEREMARQRLADAGYDFPGEGEAVVDEEEIEATLPPPPAGHPTWRSLARQMTREQVLEAMGRFDQELRGKGEWATWEENQAYRYAIEHAGQRYPIKQILRLALNFPYVMGGGEQVAAPIRKLGFTIVELPGRGESSAPSGDPALEEPEQSSPTSTESDGPIFVIIQGPDRGAQRYGLRYELPNYQSGEYRKLQDALQAWQGGGPAVRLLIYRPAPHYSFTAWAIVTRVELRTDVPRRDAPLILHLQQHEFDPPLNLKENAAALMDEISWLAGGLVAFRNHTVRQISPEEFDLIIELANSLRDDPRFLDLGNALWALAQSPEPPPMPILHADADTKFWRTHFPTQLWPEAQRAGVIGMGKPIESTNQSVKRFEQIKTGDRIVVYLSGGVIGGVGIVTSPAVDIRVESADGIPPDLFGGEYPRRLRVRWSPALPDPVNLYELFQEEENATLYHRLSNPNTIVPLRREDYAALLALLGIDDLSPEPKVGILPTAWPTLAPFRDFVQSLGPGPHSPAALWERAAAFGQAVNEELDEQSFLEELRQLRLLAPVPEQPDAYQPQPHTIGDPTALLRLMALALLVPAEGTETEYDLPARTLVPRLLATQGEQRVESFAPVLGEEGPKLLAWYAEAGLVTQDEAGWQPAPAGWEPLPGDDAATREANELVAALRHERREALPPIADGPLPAVPDFAARLRELTQDFIIDEGLVRRIVRSLLAGRHVVLSGPPGTGKTELAKRLPLLFWRGESHTLTQLTSDPDQEPVLTEQAQRHGYLPLLVTATEDWGVRDVVGGIAPRLDGSERSLGYDIQHGHLTRAILRHYEGTEQGKRLRRAGDYQRTEVWEKGKRYQGLWLVIDEFTRAPVDAAFGSLLTTLGGGDAPRLAVPSGDFGEAEVPLPKDFRIIGTLNSFDRHFLNQMSEALKRRFDFIDVPPPPPSRRDDEQGIAAASALKRLRANGMEAIEEVPEGYRWGDLWVQPDPAAGGAYRLGSDSETIRAVLRSFWNLFEAIRVFRQLGTAQAVAVYSTLFAGVLVDMGWEEALDVALADSLADQLQVMERDERRILALYVERAGDAAEFTDRVKKLAEQMPPGRRPALLRTLREADEWRTPGESSDLPEEDPKLLTAVQLSRVFALGEPLTLPPASHFLRRLRALIGERGL